MKTTVWEREDGLGECALVVLSDHPESAGRLESEPADAVLRDLEGVAGVRRAFARSKQVALYGSVRKPLVRLGLPRDVAARSDSSDAAARAMFHDVALAVAALVVVPCGAVTTRPDRLAEAYRYAHRKLG